MELTFTATLFHWRGPSPYHFLAVPEEMAEVLHEASALVTYGWGMIPVTAQIGQTTWKTSLFPKDGGYVVPIRDNVRKAEDLELDAEVEIKLTLTV